MVRNLQSFIFIDQSHWEEDRKTKEIGEDFAKFIHILLKSSEDQKLREISSFFQENLFFRRFSMLPWLSVKYITVSRSYSVSSSQTNNVNSGGGAVVITMVIAVRTTKECQQSAFSFVLVTLFPLSFHPPRLNVSSVFVWTEKSTKVWLPHFKSCDQTFGKFQYYTTFCLHGTILHGTKYVKEFHRSFNKRNHLT